MRLLYLGNGWRSIVEQIRQSLPAGCSIDVWERGQDPVPRLTEVDVVLPSNAGFSAEWMDAAPRLKLIQQPAAGVDGIDRAAARARGIPVCNAPGTNHQAVAETALYLILALAKRQPVAASAFAARTVGQPVGMELAGKTLGIVGLGRSGSRLATIAAALDMAVVSISSGSSQADFHALLATSDVISIHCPLRPETRGLFDESAFARMKHGALLINCARGAIVDRAALEDALKSGRLGGAGLDVFWQEPWDPRDSLFSRKDVVTLPHVAGSTEKSFERITAVVCENVARIRDGRPPIHLVPQEK